MLNIVVPMAGRGSRFAQAGYDLPKPLIDVHGRPMIEYVTKNIRPDCEHRFIYICQQEHLEKYDLKKTAVYGISTGGVQSTKFALYTHGIYKSSRADHLEFTVRAKNGFSVGEILTAAEHLGYTDVEHNWRISSDDGEKHEVFILKGGTNHHKAMMVYLSLEFERTNLTGFYTEIE